MEIEIIDYDDMMEMNKWFFFKTVLFCTKWRVFFFY